MAVLGLVTVLHEGILLIRLTSFHRLFRIAENWFGVNVVLDGACWLLVDLVFGYFGVFVVVEEGRSERLDSLLDEAQLGDVFLDGSITVSIGSIRRADCVSRFSLWFSSEMTEFCNVSGQWDIFQDKP